MGTAGCWKRNFPKLIIFVLFMTGFKTIQGKALLLLITFISNFFVVCHCQAHEAATVTHRHSCCCGSTAATAHHPSHDDNDCPATHAVKFNLQEKQVASNFFAAAPMVAVIAEHFIIAVNGSFVMDEAPFRKIYFYKHSPPDFQSLYQRFLI
jgi:hypothetical protein